jgi:predicted  nucleic acid-binding Zn-ribbon protein
MLNIIEVVSSILGSSAVSSLATIYFTKKKSDAESEDIMARTYERLVKNCMQEIERLKIQSENQQDEIDELRKRDEERNKDRETLLRENNDLKSQILTLRKRIEELEKNVNIT